MLLCGVLPLVSGRRRVVMSTRPSSKQRSAPRRPVWCSKWPLMAQLVEKMAQGWFMYLFCSFGWSSGPSLVDTGRVRSFACFLKRPFARKGHIFCLWRSLWRLFGLNTGEIRTERSCFMYEKVMVECVFHCCISFWVHVRFAAAFRVFKGGECFGTSRCPGGVRNV